MDVTRFLLAYALLLVVSPAWAQTTEPLTPSTVPGVQFTKIQDLNPNASGTNRPVKNKWAVVIGASRFKERRLIPSETNDMDQSARDFYNYLIDEQAGRFERSHVKLLLNSSATRQNILTALGSEWLGRAVGPDDLVVVYIATNAFPTTDGNTYLCAYDCALDNIYGTCISMQTLMNTLRQNVRCDRILLVLQAAYSGAAELETGAKALYSGYNVDLEKLVLGKGYVILSSSQPNEITCSSAFTKNLITALRLENGLISLQKAFAIARDQTARETILKNVSRKQTPVMKADWSGAALVVGTPPLEQVSDLPANMTNFLSAEACYLKATQFVTAGNINAALPEYENAIKIDPFYADALADYGAALTIAGNSQKAALMYERAIAVHPDDELFHLNYACVLEKLNNNQKCMSELEKAYSLNPRDMSILAALANRHLSSNRFADAIRFLTEAVALYPSNADLHERLSFSYASIGNLEKTHAHAREAVRLDPRSFSARLNLGSVLMIRGNFAEAVSAYKEASNLAPENHDIHYFMSRALEKLGDRANARNELSLFIRFAKESDPRVPVARKHLTEL